MVSEVSAEIQRRLDAVEREYEVRVLLAVESGSRAWGFPSPDSDYDVRFVYAHPRDWYLSVDVGRKRDVLDYEITDEIDLNGWDVRKALWLFRKSNPAFVEWIQSPVVYRERGHFREYCLEALDRIYAPEKGIHHYRRMTRSNWARHLSGESVSLKKYFYALRALLAIRWIERYRQAPPIELDKLFSLLDDVAVYEAIQSLLQRKLQAREAEKGPPVAVLNRFIEAELHRLEEERPAASEATVGIEDLNRIFRAVLDEAD